MAYAGIMPFHVYYAISPRDFPATTRIWRPSMHARNRACLPVSLVCLAWSDYTRWALSPSQPIAWLGLPCSAVLGRVLVPLEIFKRPAFDVDAVPSRVLAPCPITERINLESAHSQYYVVGVNTRGMPYAGTMALYRDSPSTTSI